MNCEAQSDGLLPVRVGDEFDVRVKVEGNTGKRTKGGTVWWVRTSDGSMVEACEVVLRGAKRAPRALAVGERVSVVTRVGASTVGGFVGATGTIIALHGSDAWVDLGQHRSTYSLYDLVRA